MKKVLLDSNIIIDFLANSREHHQEAVKLFASASEDLTLCYSFGSISDIAYILAKNYTIDNQKVAKFFYTLSNAVGFECISLSDAFLKKACRYTLDQPNSDFEDVLQYFCAIQNGCDAIITNDRDFVAAKLPLIRTNPHILDYIPTSQR